LPDTALKGLNSTAGGETPGYYEVKNNNRTLKGFNPYRVGGGDDECAHNPRVSPLAVEFLPFREKKCKSTPVFRVSSL
jgi:hypothetical protein